MPGGDDSITRILEPPFDVRVSERASRISNLFLAVDRMTSAELVVTLANSKSGFQLYEAQHDVATDIDGSLMWSRVFDLRLIGDVARTHVSAFAV